MDFDNLPFIVAILVLFILLWQQQRRIKVLEFDLEALRTTFLAYRDDLFAHLGTGAEPAAPSVVEEAAPEAALPESEAEPAIPALPETELAAAAAPKAPRPDIETALGTRWAVWVGGLALALGGIFLVRYSIEAGIFGPGARLAMASLLGLALVGGGEFVRRRGLRTAPGGIDPAHIPGILTTAGAFVLFGVVYAAHGIYGFIGPAPAFVLLGLVGIATIVAALAHGQALAGLGLLGSLATPVLVASTAPNPWALFGFLAVVLAAAAAVARLRDWRLLAGFAFAGTGVWALLYLLDGFELDLAALSFIEVVTVAVLAAVWLGGDTGEPEARSLANPDPVAIVTTFFIMLALLALGLDDALAAAGAPYHVAAIVVSASLAALWRPAALPLLYGAAVATVAVYLVSAFGWALDLDFGPGGTIAGSARDPAAVAALWNAGLVLILFFLAAGLWKARAFLTDRPLHAGVWAAAAAILPVAVLLSIWFMAGDPERDFRYALAALVLAAVLLFAGEGLLTRGERPPQSGGPAVSAALAGAAAAFLVVLHAAFGSGPTTLLAGAFAAVPAFATRLRAYPVLGWIGVGAALFTLARMGFDPTLVGEHALGATPVWNFLLPGYGVPALAFAYAAWQLARTTGGRPRLAMEALAALAFLLAAAMLVRHAMNGGVIATGAPRLAEQAIYSLLAIGGGAVLMALDRRSPSPVFRLGSIGLGIASMAFIAVQHFAVLNPVVTNESTGTIPFFNLLLLAYLFPCAALAALAWWARGKRPQWYVSLLALAAALLGFAYLTLSVRRWFKGEFIGHWKGVEQLEMYAYSAAWLALGVVVLVAGVRLGSQTLRIASAALVVLAVAKVFLFDMAQLEGVLRALSFIGLGAVLIGIGLFYQRMLGSRPATPPA